MSFAAVTAVRQKDSHTYLADFSADWVIGKVPNGGYVTSVFQQVAKTHFATTLRKQNQPHTLALHAEFLRRTQVGPATFVVKDVKLGRQMSVVHITLVQDNREEVVAYITQTDLTTEKGVTFDTEWTKEAQLHGVDTKKLTDGSHPDWIEKQTMPAAEFRKAMNHMRLFFPRGGQHSRSGYDFWTCPRDPSGRWTDISLGYLVDMFPQIIERYLLDGFDPYSTDLDTQPHLLEERRKSNKDSLALWYPTVLLNLDVKKALPEEGERFLFTQVRPKQIKNGRYDLEIVIVDPQGEVVALSHHICLIVSAARNTAARRKTDGGANL